jgi:hypothetical protein
MRFGIVFAAALLMLTGCGTPAGPEIESSTAAPSQAAPRYSVKDARAESDGRPDYYVVVDPVDLSNDGFKQRVKLVLQAVARTKGDPDFVATVYDDQGAADWAWAHLEDIPESCELGGPCGTRPPLPGDPEERRRSDEQFRAEQHDSERHVVAFYSGGYKSERPWPYELSWYPFLADVVTDTGEEVKYEGKEEWRPLPDPTTAPSAAPTAEPLNGTYAFLKHYGRDEKWTFATTCDAASGDCKGEVTSSAGWTEPIRREHFGPWTLDRKGAESGWDCGISTPRDFPGRKADIHYSWDPATGRGTVSWVAPRSTCMPDEEDYTTTFGLKQ